MRQLRAFLFLLCCILSVHHTTAQPVQQGEHFQSIQKVQVLEDGSYVAVFTCSDSVRVQDTLYSVPTPEQIQYKNIKSGVVVACFTEHHQLKWAHSIFANRIEISDIHQTENGDVLFTGVTNGNVWSADSFWYETNRLEATGMLWCMEQNGATQWSIFHQAENGVVRFRCGLSINDDLYVLAEVYGKYRINNKNWYNYDDPAVMVLKFSSDGNLIYANRALANSLSKTAVKMVKADDRTLVIGMRYSDANFIQDMSVINRVNDLSPVAKSSVLITFDIDGNVKHHHTISGGNVFVLNDLAADQNGIVFYAGVTLVNSRNKQETNTMVPTLSVGKYDPELKKSLWMHHFYNGSTSAITRIILPRDGRLYVMYPTEETYTRLDSFSIQSPNPATSVLVSLDTDSGAVTSIKVLPQIKVNDFSAHRQHFYIAGSQVYPDDYVAQRRQSRTGYLLQKMPFPETDVWDTVILPDRKRYELMYAKQQRHPSAMQNVWEQEYAAITDPLYTQGYQYHASQILEVNGTIHILKASQKGISHVVFDRENPQPIWVDTAKRYPDQSVSTSGGASNRWAKLIQTDALMGNDGKIHLAYVVQYKHHYLDQGLPSALNHAAYDPKTKQWTIKPLHELPIGTIPMFDPYVSMVADAKGEVHIFYHHGSRELFHQHLTSSGWKQSSLQLNAPLKDAYDVVFGDDGETVVAYADEKKLVREIHRAGNSPVVETVLEGNIMEVDLGKGGNGNQMLISFRNNDATRVMQLCTKTEQGWQFVFPLQQTKNLSFDFVVETPKDLHIVAYNRYGYGTYLYSNDGGQTWLNLGFKGEHGQAWPRGKSGLLADQSGIRVLTTRNNMAYVHLRQHPNKTIELRPPLPAPDTLAWKKAWSESQALPFTEANPDVAPDFQLVSTDKKIHVLYKNNAHLFLATSNHQGKEWEVTTLSDTFQNGTAPWQVGRNPVMLKGKGRELDIFYSIYQTSTAQKTTTALVHVTYENGFWLSDTLQMDSYTAYSAKQIQHMQIAVTQNGKALHLVYYDGASRFIQGKKVADRWTWKPVYGDLLPMYPEDEMKLVKAKNGHSLLAFHQNDQVFAMVATETDHFGAPEPIMRADKFSVFADENGVFHFFGQRRREAYTAHVSYLPGVFQNEGFIFHNSLKPRSTFELFHISPVQTDDNGNWYIAFPSLLQPHKLVPAFSPDYGKSWTIYESPTQDNLPHRGKVGFVLHAKGISLLYNSGKHELMFRNVRVDGVSVE